MLSSFLGSYAMLDFFDTSSEETPETGDSDTSSVVVVDESSFDSSSDIVIGSLEDSSSPVLIIGESSYDDTQLLIVISDINGRLEDINTKLADSNVMSLWGLWIAVGVLLSYFFYSIAKKFI